MIDDVFAEQAHEPLLDLGEETNESDNLIILCNLDIVVIKSLSKIISTNFLFIKRDCMNMIVEMHSGFLVGISCLGIWLGIFLENNCGMSYS